MPTLITLVDNTVPVANDFNSNYQALNNAIGSSTVISAWSTGEMPYASATNTLARLTPGSLGQALVMTTTIPAWGNAGAMDQITGLTLSNNSGDATNDIDIAVGAAASDDAAIASRVFISLTSAMTKRLDAAWAVGSATGGLASGTTVANTTYHTFVILRPDTGVVDVAFDTSAAGANIAAATTTAYTKMRRIGSFMRESGANIAFTQDGDYFRRSVSVLDVNAANPGDTAVTRTLSVPVGINVVAGGNLILEAPAAGASVFLAHLSDLAATDEAPTVAAATPAAMVVVFPDAAQAQWAAVPFRVRTNTAAQIRSRTTGSAASYVIRLATTDWWDRRGRG